MSRLAPLPSPDEWTEEEDRLGFFGPDSITWRVHSDPSYAVGGLRALMLQALHPVAMDGVARNSAAGLRGMADAMLNEPDRVAELAATGLPLLVAHGEADDAWLPHVQADMAERLGARHEVILNSIHSPAVENPTRTVEVLLDFWAGASVRS